MPLRIYDSFDDFLDDLDRSGNLSDDPFEVDVHETLDDEDLALIGGGRKRAPAPKSKPKSRKDKK